MSKSVQNNQDVFDIFPTTLAFVNSLSKPRRVWKSRARLTYTHAFRSPYPLKYLLAKLALLCVAFLCSLAWCRHFEDNCLWLSVSGFAKVALSSLVAIVVSVAAAAVLVVVEGFLGWFAGVKSTDDGLADWFAHSPARPPARSVGWLACWLLHCGRDVASLKHGSAPLHSCYHCKLQPSALCVVCRRASVCRFGAASVGAKSHLDTRTHLHKQRQAC